MEYQENLQKKREVSLRTTDGAQGLPLGLIEISRDCILPDSYADIKRILSVSASLVPSNGYAEGGKAFYAGELLCRVLFVSDEGKNCSVPFTLEYEGSAPLGSADGEYTAVFMPNLESVNARSVNPRKIGIKAKVNPGLFTWERRDASVRFPSQLTRADIESFEEKNEEISYLSLRHKAVSGLESGDDIRIEAPMGAVGEVLFCDITFSGVRCEARKDAVAVNATADVTVAFREDGKDDTSLRFLHHAISLSSLVPCEGACEGDLCLASLYCEKISCVPAENAQGEKRILELDFSYGIQAICECRETMLAVKDMYSTRYECENTEGEIRISRSVGKQILSHRCTKEASFKENGSVMGMIPAVKGVYLTLGDDRKGIAEGTLLAYVLILEEDGSMVCETVDLPFSLPTDLSFSEKPECFLRAMPENGKATLLDGKLTVEIPMTVSILAWENVKERVIFSSAVLAETEKRDESAFTVYFPTANESLWDIAKKYKISTDRLFLTGGENGGVGRRALILPPKSKEIFSGVIS
ncbi:MAG: DUF3794 domain-containing protein [Clostridia bacterium]|nr:DUF3794 domain-containing protein [Clostridia bacterium]